ncbi:MAG: radical SAM family heme chaperone HemW [Acidobacteriota bacterium]
MPAGIYIHVPFCRSRCSYCDFATDVYRDSAAVERYVEALCREIGAFETVESEADTLYFGGGTPSLLTSRQLQRLIEMVRSKFSLSAHSEITLEMNPATVTADSLDGYRSLGVNRASFGVQTFNDRHLKLLARGHDADDARNTYRMLRSAGYENISLDLIAGLPGQSFADWERNLDEALGLAPEHLSLYLLEIHEGTPLAEQVRSGRRPVPDPELAADMYEHMIDKLAAAGYEQYEISNFAKPGFASKHNSKYWTLDPVYGFGVSAHSFDGKMRYANERDTASYVRMISAGENAESMRETVDVASEFVFLGLRLTRGISLAGYSDRFGSELIGKFAAGISELENDQLISLQEGQMQLTRKGMLYSNQVFAEFV